MIDRRLWTALALAGCLLGRTLSAQEAPSGGASPSGNGGSGSGSANGNSNAGGGSNGSGDSSGKSGSSGSDSSGNGASSSFGTPAPPPAKSPFASPGEPELPSSPFGTPSTPSSPFGSAFGTPAKRDSGENQTDQGTTPENGGTTETPTKPQKAEGGGPFAGPSPFAIPGAASAFGSGAVVKPAPEALPQFNRPAAYGGNSPVFSGIGLSKPRIRYSVSVQFGLDDNVLQTPTNSPAIPAMTQQMEVSPATPAVTQNVVFPAVRSNRVAFFAHSKPTVKTIVVQQPKKAEFETVVLSPAIPAQSRIASFVMRTSAGMDVQFVSRKTVFSMDVNLGEDIYANRPGNKTDPNEKFSIGYIRRLTPRLEFDFTANASYQSQPDVQNLNTSSQNLGSYLVGGAKTDLIYRWSKRFTLDTSLGFDSTLYTSSTQKGGDMYETSLSTEGRYLWSPKFTSLTRVDYVVKSFPQAAARDSTGYNLLLGADIVLSRKFRATARFGESLQTFTQSNQTNSSPYAETNVSWQYDRFGFLSWNTHYGFEDPPDANTTVKTLRSGINIIQALNKKLRASGGLTYVARQSLNSATAGVPDEDTIEADLGMEYTINRNFVLSGTYTFTTVLNTGGVGDYYRNQIFFGINYTF